ncbi:MAG: low-specificity L-threonine aldolase [Candidatus Acetothermia bacterium]|jgi:threonine aldolase|nr:low-specificity L-threonine aldolase [Candidatus Acetothermia bacterium]MDH7505167.1 low-specificity L-threonine aldolase [Candidatus Acetothermia bacterium]
MIDLRSDTVTKPTAGMRRAMAAAEVGDDVYGEDPTVNKLQERAAELLGLEAALFVPSGTMGNQIAVKVHTRPGDEVILEADSHIFNYEMGMMAAFSGVLARPIQTARGVLPLEAVAEAIRSAIYYLSRTGLVCIENTHNRKSGAIYPLEAARELLEFAHSKGLPVHLDGARIFNAAVALGLPARELARGLDSVMFCLSKGLGAPVGSLLLGSRAFIEEARRVRKMLGGGMRQAGVLAAAGLYALEHHIDCLAEDHENARLLAQGLAELGSVQLEPVETNIVIFNLKEMSAAEFAEQMKERGILVHAIGPQRIRLVTHLDVSREQIVKAVAAARELLGRD